MKKIPEIIGSSPPICALKRKIHRLASLDVTTLIQGPSGSGKELVARSLHNLSARKHGPWVALNCAAIPEDLFESQLFGHCQGTFTGADRKMPGLLSQAHGGTLLLDEVGELPKNVQAKLLRVLEERRVRPLGAQREHPIDIRVISASHQPLSKLVAKGQFRTDLYHRLHLAVIETPALHSLGNDLLVLAELFIARAASNYGLTPKKLNSSAIEALNRHPFPGNIRELDHIVTAALIFADGDSIGANDLGLPSSKPSLDSLGTHTNTHRNLDQFLAETEAKVIAQALKTHDYDKKRAAKQLAITERALRYRIQKYQNRWHD